MIETDLSFNAIQKMLEFLLLGQPKSLDMFFTYGGIVSLGPILSLPPKQPSLRTSFPQMHLKQI